jgi:hypothetical protein
MLPSQGREVGPIPITRSNQKILPLGKIFLIRTKTWKSDRRSQARNDLGEPGLEENSAEFYRKDSGIPLKI